MKFTKFIPMAMALALAVTPAFAANTDTVNTELQITNPEYFNVTELAGAVKSDQGTAEITEVTETGALTLSYTTPMAVTYRVVNNMADKVFYVKATALGASQKKAFGGTAVNAMKIAFANTAVAPTDNAIDNVTGASPDPDSNANVIGFTFTPAAVVVDEGSISAPSLSSQQLSYTAQPGNFRLPFSLGTTAIPETFSSIDQAGIYKAKITVTDVGP